MTAVATDGESRWDFDRAVWSVGLNPCCEAVFLNEASGLPTHAKSEVVKAGGLCGEKVEEVPLGHKCDEFRVGGEVREIGHSDTAVADVSGEVGDLRVRNSEKFVEQT